jgi:hypothetical protein
MFHVVYLSFEEGEEGRDYVGKHSSTNPYDEYLGSYKDKSFNPAGKIILEYANTEEGAVEAEVRWQKVFKVVEDPQYANQSYQTNTGFVVDTRGEKHPFYGKKRPDVTKRNLEDNPARRPGAGDKISKAMTGRKCSEEESIRRFNRLKEYLDLNPNHQVEAGTKAGQKSYERGYGLFAPENRGKGGRSVPPEVRSANGTKGSSVVNKQKWQCLVTGHVSNSGGLTSWQKARGIDTSLRRRLEG